MVKKIVGIVVIGLVLAGNVMAAKFEVKEYKGVPTLHINGEPKFCQIDWSHNQWESHNAWGLSSNFEKRVKKLAKSGNHIYLLNSHLGWTDKEGVYNYDATEKVFDKILENDPHAYLMSRIDLGFSYIRRFDCRYPGHDKPLASWWYKKYPGELIKTTIHETIQKASFASKLWRRDAGKALDAYIKHFTEGKYKDRFLGCCVNYGQWGEWQYWGYQQTDIEQPMLRGFREWLRKKYKGNVSALRTAWGDKRVDFTTAKPANEVDKIKSELGVFINPAGQSQLSDWRRYKAELVADNIVYFCEIAKKAGKGNIVCGATYGGLMDCGDVELTNILESAAVDFLETPHSYYGREIGTGDCSFMSVTESQRLHGKLRINESDTRTCFGSASPIYGRPDNLKDSIELLKRDFGQILCRSVGHWWISEFSYTFDHPAIWKCLSKLHKIGDISIEYDRSYTGGIAMIVDEESTTYHSFFSGILFPMLYRQRMDEFGRIGTPWDVYLHNDLSHSEMPDYKVYLFLNTFYLTAREREEIKKKVCRNNNIVIWMYAPGFQTPEGFSLKSVRDLTGMNVKYVDGPSTLLVSITDTKHPYTKGLKKRWFGNIGWGREPRPLYAPTFYVDDPTVTVLGEMDMIDKAGFCVKDMGNWTSVYVGAPMITAEILRNICKHAGVHIYSETEDVLYANKHFVVISTREKGEKTIKLPRKSNVYEIYDNRLVGKNVTEFTEKLPAKATRIYLLKE